MHKIGEPVYEIDTDIYRPVLIYIFQYLESTLHTLVFATLDKPQTSFQVVGNNIC